MSAQAFTNLSGNQNGNSNEPTSYVASDGFVGAPAFPFNPNSPTFSAAVFQAGAQLATGTLLVESVAAGLTATAGGGQANALLLTNEVNQITTVATIGDSVRLPLAQAGLTVYVINNGGKAMQVYGSGTDTIDGAATATGVAQMNGSEALFTCVSSAPGGAWVSEGIGTGYSGGLQTVSYTSGITAHAGGGQANATQLTTTLNQVTTVASANDSVKLPASAPGLQVTVINNAATNSMQLFGLGTDTVNGAASGTGVAVAAGKSAVLTCYVAGAWVGPVALA